MINIILFIQKLYKIPIVNSQIFLLFFCRWHWKLRKIVIFSNIRLIFVCWAKYRFIYLLNFSLTVKCGLNKSKIMFLIVKSSPQVLWFYKEPKHAIKNIINCIMSVNQTQFYMTKCMFIAKNTKISSKYSIFEYLNFHKFLS